MSKKINTVAAPLALAMILSGCMSLAPKYERPAAPVADAKPSYSRDSLRWQPTTPKAPHVFQTVRLDPFA